MTDRAQKIEEAAKEMVDWLAEGSACWSDPCCTNLRAALALPVEERPCSCGHKAHHGECFAIIVTEDERWGGLCECALVPAPSAPPAEPGERGKCSYNAWCCLPAAHKDGCLSEAEAKRIVGKRGERGCECNRKPNEPHTHGVGGTVVQK